MKAAQSHRKSRKFRRIGRHTAPSPTAKVARRAGQAAPAVAVLGGGLAVWYVVVPTLAGQSGSELFFDAIFPVGDIIVLVGHDSGNRSLHRVGSRSVAQRRLGKAEPFCNGHAIPQTPILIFEQNQIVIRAAARDAARIVQQHEGQQAAHLGLRGKEFV